MKRTTLVVLGLLCACLMAAQTSTPPTGMNGSNLRTWLKTNWFEGYHIELGYDTARRKLYNFIDNHDNQIVDVYTGFIVPWTYGGAGTNPQPINCEHTVPQSLFFYAEPMKSDLHHLFPVHGSANSSRNNNPFAEIDDNLTSKWWYNGTSQTTIPTSEIDDYSEYYGGTFEPREDHKGNVARAVFYFYTMYPGQGSDISQVADLEVLYQWHLNDPVDPFEVLRNGAIESFQGDRNPYIDHPEWVAQAWGFTTPPTQLFISEYVEGTSYNKAIEIVNLTGSSVNLADYTLRKQTNGSGTWTSGLNLQGTLMNGETYVIAHSSATTVLAQLADTLTGNQAVTFNGNDPVGLFYNGNLIDIVGEFDGGSANFAQNTTLRRKSSIVAPNSQYTLAEWDGFSVNTFSDVGSYSNSKAPSFAYSELAEAKVSAFPNPCQSQLNLVLSGDWEKDVQITILDIYGRSILRKELYDEKKYQVPTETLETGVYLVKISDGIQEINQRVVKN